ncbi:D-arabinono-1,4-lactone oxidase, partial [Bacillus sp. B-TM1]
MLHLIISSPLETNAILDIYFGEVEKIFLKYEGRPHWGKMHTLTYEKLQNIYPELHSFLKVRKLLDEAEMFSNP